MGSTQAKQAGLDFPDIYGDAQGDGAPEEEGPDPSIEEGSEEEGLEDTSEDPEMRLVKKRRESARGAGGNYARMGAAGLTAKIQFLMPPSDQVHPELGAEIRVIDEREYQTSGPHSVTRTAKTWGVYTTAPEAVVDWAADMRVHADGRSAREVAFLWALQEYHQSNWVQARRLFAAAREPRWSGHCLRKWPAKKLRTFYNEIDFPSHAYDTFAEYGEEQGAFYFGGDWREAKPRRSRRPLWYAPEVDREPSRY